MHAIATLQKLQLPLGWMSQSAFARSTADCLFQARTGLLFLLAAFWIGHAADAQVQPIQFRVRSTSDQAMGLDLPRAPREIRRALTRAQRAIDDERYADAVEAISEIIQDPNTEDYFLPSGGDSGLPQSLKSRAQDMLGALPPAGREIYELQAGSTAKRLLNEAVRSRSFEGLNEVSRRFFHTKAGYQASYLMGRYCLDQSRPVAAAIHLKRLRDVGTASHEFEPDLSFYLATSWLLANNQAAAREALLYLQELLPEATFEVAGRQVALPAEDKDVIAWLEKILANLPEPRKPNRFAWTMFRGGPARNGHFEGDAPIPKLEWQIKATTIADYEDRINSKLRMMTSAGQAPLCALHPLAIGKTVLMRTPHMLFGVDLESGRRIWPFPWDTPQLEVDTLLQLPYRQQKDPTAAFVIQRLWQDGVHGQLSCNESTVFVLQDLRPLGSVIDSGNQLNLLRRGLVPIPTALKENSNQLVALDLAAEGKTRWIVGGKDGEVPDLESAFFMGPPLPLGDSLFVLAELQDEIRLCALNAESGALAWSQQVAQVESPFAWYLDAVRRLAGCSPSFSDGIMVCPTSSGLVVAVDVDSRSLLWAYEYRRDATRSSGRHQIAQLRPSSASMPELGERWTDNATLIVDGCVLMTPVDSSSLHCLDLLTGKKLWTKNRQKPTSGDYLFLAGVHEDVIVLVGEHSVQGVSLVDGRAVWPAPLDIPDGAMPSGQGFLSGNVFHLPTTASELLRIDVMSGELVERVPTGEVLGNLICHGDYIISQSAMGLNAYLRRDRARNIVERRLEEKPSDVETWETYGSLLMGEGQMDEAVEALRNAVRLAGASNDRAPVRATLVDVLMRQLEEGSEKVDLEEVQSLAASLAERKRLYRIMIERSMADGNLALALDHCLSRWMLMAEASTSSAAAPLVAVDTDWSVSERVWLRRRFEQLLEEVDPSQRESVAKRAQTRIGEATSERELPYDRHWLSALPAGFKPATSTLDETDELLRKGRFLEAQMSLLELLRSPQEELQTTALAKLARLYQITGNQQLAAKARGRLLRESSAGTESAQSNEVNAGEAFDHGSQAFGHGSQYDAWPRGAVEFEEVTMPPNQVRQPQSVEVRSQGDWPEGWALTYDPNANRLEIRNELGRVVRIAGLPSVSRSSVYRGQTYARAYGQLIVFNMGTRVVAIDAIGERYSERSRVLWTSDDAELFPESQRAVARAGFGGRRVVDPFGQPRTAAPEILGPVSASSVCFFANGSLRCVDPITGNTLWLRNNLSVERDRRGRLKSLEVYGDADRVFVQAEHESEARVFKMLDGTDLGVVKVPAVNRQWTRQGRMILSWQQPIATRSLLLQVYDPLTERNVWELQLPRSSQGTLVGTDEVATLTPDGLLEIRRIVDGQLLATQQIDLQPVARGALHVSRSCRDYVVMVSDQPHRQTWSEEGNNVTITAPPTGMQKTPHVSGKVFAISRETGEELWNEPLEVRDFFVPLNQPEGTPWLAFTRTVAIDDRAARRARRIRRNQHTAVALLDRRNGDVVFLKQDLPYSPRMFTMSANWDERVVSIQLQPRNRIELALTDEPRLKSSRVLPTVMRGAHNPEGGEPTAGPLMPR